MTTPSGASHVFQMMCAQYGTHLDRVTFSFGEGLPVSKPPHRALTESWAATAGLGADSTGRKSPSQIGRDVFDCPMAQPTEAVSGFGIPCSLGQTTWFESKTKCLLAFHGPHLMRPGSLN